MSLMIIKFLGNYRLVLIRLFASYLGILNSTICLVKINQEKLMKNKLWLLLLLLGIQVQAANIGFLIVATGRYIEFVPSLIKSAEQYFCPGHSITYFVFT